MLDWLRCIAQVHTITLSKARSRSPSGKARLGCDHLYCMYAISPHRLHLLSCGRNASLLLYGPLRVPIPSRCHICSVVARLPPVGESSGSLICNKCAGALISDASSDIRSKRACTSSAVTTTIIYCRMTLLCNSPPHLQLLPA